MRHVAVDDNVDHPFKPDTPASLRRALGLRSWARSAFTSGPIESRALRAKKKACVLPFNVFRYLTKRHGAQAQCI